MTTACWASCLTAPACWSGQACFRSESDFLPSVVVTSLPATKSFWYGKLPTNELSSSFCTCIYQHSCCGKCCSTLSWLKIQTIGWRSSKGLHGKSPNGWGNHSLGTLGSANITHAVVQATFFIALAVASRMGTAALAAHQIVAQLWLLTSYVTDGFAVAGTVLGSRLSHRQHDPEDSSDTRYNGIESSWLCSHNHCNRSDVCTGSQGLVGSRQGIECGVPVAC